jgi:hypothetical protein
LADWQPPQDLQFSDDQENCAVSVNRYQVFTIVLEELRFGGLRRLENGFGFKSVNNCHDEKCGLGCGA